MTRWDTGTWASGDALRADSAAALAFSADGATLSAVGRDGVVRAWEARTGRPLRAARTGGAVARAALTTATRAVATVADVSEDDDPTMTAVTRLQLWSARPARAGSTGESSSSAGRPPTAR